MPMFPMIANGNVYPAAFVKVDTTVDNHCLTAGASDKPVGIAQKGERGTPLDGLQDGFAAIATESLQIYGPGMTAPIRLGGTVAAGDFLKPTTNGAAITAGSDGDWYGAIAGQAGVSGQVIECFVQIGSRGA